MNMKFPLFQDFVPPKKPFRRMAYTDAIKYLKEHDIKKDDGSYYEFGDVSIQPFCCYAKEVKCAC